MNFPKPGDNRLAGYAGEIAKLGLVLSRCGGADVVSGFSRTHLLARLNALTAGVFQLTEAEFVHVLGTFPLVPQEDRDEALAEFMKEFC